MNKIIMTFFILALVLIQTNSMSAIADTGSINVDVKSMPQLELEFSGPYVIRSGDTAFIKIKIFNNDSDENITLDSIKIFDEENKFVVPEKI